MKYYPKVTIIIPVYNGSNFLAEAIDAALRQTYKNCEVIVINDGSTDNGASEKIALSYGNKIRYFYKKNGGVSSALNYAFEKMTGEWFSWLSHDDLYYQDKIEKQIKFINELLKDNVSLNLSKITVRCATESIDKNGKVIRLPNYEDIPICEKQIDTILNNIYNYRLSGCSFLLPSSCIKDIGKFNENIRTVSDVEYWYRLLFSGYQFYCLKNYRLVKNRSHGKQVGKTKIRLFNKEREELFIWIANEIGKKEEFNTLDNFLKLFYGLKKNHCNKAANYVLKTYIKNKTLKESYIKILIISSYYVMIGKFRNIARYIYRKINVK